MSLTSHGDWAVSWVAAEPALRFCRLRTSRPAPASSTSAIATSAATSPRRSEPRVPELCRSRNTSLPRRENWSALHPIICQWLDGFKTVDDAVKALTGARVPAAAVLSPAEVVAHPHLAERQAFPEIEHPGRGKVRITAVPFHVDSRPVKPRGGAPYRVGEHTRTVLADLLGYSRERIEELARLGAIATV